MSNSKDQEKTGYNFTPFEALCKETNYEGTYEFAERGDRVKYKDRNCILYRDGAVNKGGNWYFTLVLLTNNAQDYVENVSSDDNVSSSDIGIGSTVEVVKYGHVIWRREEGEDKLTPYDMLPDIVGMRGIVRKVINQQGRKKFAVDGIHDKSAWYDQQQLKKIT